MRKALLCALLVAGCGGGSGTKTVLGDPNPGLSAQMLASFQRGKEVFERRFTLAEGHGPHFNTSSCRSCHEIPVTGGSSPLYRNFFLVGDVVQGNFTPVLEDNQFVLRLFSYTRPMRERTPNADVIAQRNAPPMFGVGLFERLTNTEIVANQDPGDANGDGISGRVNLDGILVGRLGYKAQTGAIEPFVRGPIFNHMGITTDPLSFGPASVPQIGAPELPTTDNDGVPDPELPFEDLRDLVTFTRELAPPQPLFMDGTAVLGEQRFDEIGCTKCHIPNIAPDKLPVDPYTDLLLHDMGPDLADGVLQGVASGAEFRTQPLWGVRLTKPFLHDGRADSLDEAIRLHGGEAAAIRDAYAALPPGERDAIIAFLETR